MKWGEKINNDVTAVARENFKSDMNNLQSFIDRFPLGDLFLKGKNHCVVPAKIS